MKSVPNCRDCTVTAFGANISKLCLKSVKSCLPRRTATDARRMLTQLRFKHRWMTAKKDTRIQSCNGVSCTLYTPSNAPIKTNYVHEGLKFQIKYFTCVKHSSYLHSATPGFTFRQGFKYKLVISSLSAANFNQQATRRSKFPAQHIRSMYYLTSFSKHFISKVMTHLRRYLDMQTDFLVSATFLR